MWHGVWCDCFIVSTFLIWLCDLIPGTWLCPPDPVQPQAPLPFESAFLIQVSQGFFSRSFALEALTILVYVVTGYRYRTVLNKGLLGLRILASHSFWDWFIVLNISWDLFGKAMSFQSWVMCNSFSSFYIFCLSMLPHLSNLVLIQFSVGQVVVSFFILILTHPVGLKEEGSKLKIHNNKK